MTKNATSKTTSKASNSTSARQSTSERTTSEKTNASQSLHGAKSYGRQETVTTPMKKTSSKLQRILKSQSVFVLQDTISCNTKGGRYAFTYRPLLSPFILPSAVDLLLQLLQRLFPVRNKHILTIYINNIIHIVIRDPYLLKLIVKHLRKLCHHAPYLRLRNIHRHVLQNRLHFLCELCYTQLP